jgi:hypothetical protein
VEKRCLAKASTGFRLPLPALTWFLTGYSVIGNTTAFQAVIAESSSATQTVADPEVVEGPRCERGLSRSMSDRSPWSKHEPSLAYRHTFEFCEGS